MATESNPRKTTLRLDLDGHPPATKPAAAAISAGVLPDFKDQARSVVAVAGDVLRSDPVASSDGVLPTFKDQVRSEPQPRELAPVAAVPTFKNQAGSSEGAADHHVGVLTALGVPVEEAPPEPPVAIVELVTSDQQHEPVVSGDSCFADFRKHLLWAGVAVLAIAVAGAVVGIVLAGGSGGGDSSAKATAMATLPPNRASDATGDVILVDEIEGRNDGDSFGNFVILSRDGSTLAVGATDGEYVRTFHRDGSQWNQIGQTVKATGDTGRGSFGDCIALSQDGTIMAVGAWSNDAAADNAGNVKVFYYDGSSWLQIGQTLTGSSAGDVFGWEVVLADDGSTLAVGARTGDPSSDREDAGYVRVFTYEGDPQQSIDENWVQLGPDLEGEASGDQFGRSLAIDAAGRRLVVGAVTGAGEKGRIRVFDFSGGTWNSVGQALDGDKIDDWQGTSVAISADGSILAIGADGTDTSNGSNAGIVRVYKLGGSTWTQQGQDLLGEATDDQFGAGHISLSSDGACLAVGSNHDSNRGKGYLYRWSGSNFVEVATVDGADIGDHMGQSSTVSGDCSWLAFGAPQKDTSASPPGYVRIYQVV